MIGLKEECDTPSTHPHAYTVHQHELKTAVLAVVTWSSYVIKLMILNARPKFCSIQEMIISDRFCFAWMK